MPFSDKINNFRTHSSPIRVGILLLDGFALMSYAGIIEPMRAANLLSKEPLYEVAHFSPHGAPATSSSGAYIPCQPLLETPPTDTKFDRFFIIAGGDPFAHRESDLQHWLHRAGRTNLRIAGISGGPVILALAGLMQGYRMTVHWEHAARLSDEVQNLQISRTLFVIDRNRITCAGGTAPMDLMNVLIAQDWGKDFAREVSDWFLHTEIRPPIGPQKSGLIERYGTHKRAVLHAIEFMEAHIADPLSQSEIAASAGVSIRQLSRHFLDEFSIGPITFYRNLRLEQAAKYLEQTSMSITEIAFATGFSSASHFSSKFLEKYQVNPRDFQKHTQQV